MPRDKKNEVEFASFGCKIYAIGMYMVKGLKSQSGAGLRF